ncbi:3-dehydroquinate synthase [Clostridium sp. A1-XYC3]|uniref:3-dehydroquinate synthase n=1 Tax=Clostridium tanneri TaxID=3037988 RepID=A0ABU4JR42_9CLOT|nr:3-dehydroquinate synthase [Clostridium sp. A1-XYC3]MDW8800436.1 3-dehydroquinate synthase [Clostridium sp. A1-XYC3]
MKSNILKIELKENSYSIYIERNIFNKVGDYLDEHYKNRKIAIITDNNLEKLYGKNFKEILEKRGFNTKIISVKPGEESKSIDTLKEIYEKLSNFRLGREDLIIALGGGVVGDLGGFAASTYLRGVPYIQIPTSLLAQVDSSIGGKVAVDLPWGKNLIGSFYHPRAVFIDPELLKTLHKRFFHDGLAEVIKYGCIRDESIIFQLLNFKDDKELLDNIDTLILKCCSIKKSVVELDEKDFGDRMLLNFGHTLGHAVEKYFSYKEYTHGEAVAIGMAEITRKSEKLQITEKGSSKLVEEVLEKYELPYKAPLMDREEIFKAIALDKKNSGENINLILLRKMGEGMIRKVKVDELEKYI